MNTKKILVIATILVSSFLFYIVNFSGEPKQVIAQMPGGAINVSIFTQCTCGPGYLAIFTGYGDTPSGLYYFGPQTQFWTGSGYPTANNLIFYTQEAGQCSMNSGPSCYTITGNLVNWYGGSS